MGILGEILKHPADFCSLINLKIAVRHAEKQIPPEPHWRFCYTMLHEVSRSFPSSFNSSTPSFATLQVDRLKARLVVKGYKQKLRIYYFEVVAPVARMDTIRMIIALAAQNLWKIHQMDVKSDFLNCVLEEVVYVEQPPSYVKKWHENQVYKLKKALYGLK